MRVMRNILPGLLLSLASFSPAFADQASQNLQFGIFPYVSPVQMVEFHNPLRARLQQTLGVDVTLVTAPGFKEFVKRTREGHYDIILTAPHLGRLAEVQSGYQRIAQTLHEVQGIYLVREDSPIQTLPDLEGKTITMVGRSAIITQMVEHQLKQLGLQDGRNVTFRITRTHNNAMYAPLRNESDASVTGILLFNKIGEKDRQKVRIIGKTPTAPGFMLMTGKRVSAAQHEKLADAVLNFARTPEGKKYMAVTGFKRFDPIDNAQMEALDPYIQYFLTNDL